MELADDRDAVTNGPRLANSNTLSPLRCRSATVAEMAVGNFGPGGQ